MTLIAQAAQRDEKIVWDERLIRKYAVPGPRYSAYPTAAQFSESFASPDYHRYLRDKPPSIGPLSLSVHVPFCNTICHYCACNTIATRDTGESEAYMNALEKEVTLLAPVIDRRRKVTQLHWGGGAPTFLGSAEITRLMHILSSHFTLVDTPDREYSIELDPRTVNKATLALLKGLGFNRVSMGIQDFDPVVQAAINRPQSYESVAELVRVVRDYRYASLGFDLIYGLPHQSRQSMAATLDKVIALSPDRIACFSYTHLPDRLSSQRSIDRLEIPGADEQLDIFRHMVERLSDAGYLYVGMDHFVKPDDALAVALHEGTLYRNVQGYSTRRAPDLIGIGVSSISSTREMYAQNARSLERYYSLLDNGQLPVERGVHLSGEDQLRQDVIMQLICQMQVDKASIAQRHRIDFDAFFARELRALAALEADGLVVCGPDALRVSATGRVLLRTICMVFDAYTDVGQPRFSNTR